MVNNAGVMQLVAEPHYERTTRWVLTAYLVTSALNAALTLWLMDVGSGFLGRLTIGVTCLSVVALAVLVARGVVWPVTLLAVAALIFSLVVVIAAPPAREVGQAANLAGRNSSLLHLPVLIGLAVWGCVRSTNYYRKHNVTQALVLFAIIVSITYELVGGVQNTWFQLAAAMNRPGPVRELRGELIGTMQFTGMDGTPVRLDDAQKTYVVDFWTIHCQPCIKELPELIRLQNELAGSRDAEIVLALHQDPSADSDRTLPPRAAGGRVVFDTENWVDRLAIKGFPTKIVVKGGRVIDVLLGARPDSYDYIKKKLHSLPERTLAQ